MLLISSIYNFYELINTPYYELLKRITILKNTETNKKLSLKTDKTSLSL